MVRFENGLTFSKITHDIDTTTIRRHVLRAVENPTRSHAGAPHVSAPIIRSHSQVTDSGCNVEIIDEQSNSMNDLASSTTASDGVAHALVDLSGLHSQDLL